MNLLSSIFKKKNKADSVETFVTRQGHSIPTDEVFDAWTSGDLDKMLKATEKDTNPIDRHFLLQTIVTETYKLRLEDKYKKICIEFSEKHLQEFDKIVPALKDDMGGKLPIVTTFQHYATILTEIGDYEKAISICERAISFGLVDGTKSGFKGRIERIKKKMNSNT